MKIRVAGNRSVTAELAEQTPATLCTVTCHKESKWSQLKLQLGITDLLPLDFGAMFNSDHLRLF